MAPKQLPDSVNFKVLLGKAPPPLDFVLPGFVRGTVGALVSPGGTGKSYWALAVAVAISAGSKADITSLKPKEGRVLVLSKEDPMAAVEQRLHAMAKLLPKSVSYANLDFRCCVGMSIDVMDESWFSHLVEAAKNTRLVILDTLTRFHNLDENSAQDMGRLLAQLERLAEATGAGILFLHHTSKAAVTAGQATLQQAARGSSVLIDNARWAAFLSVMTEHEARLFGVPCTERMNYVRWNISKQNYGAAIPDIWYRRAEGGVLEAITMTAKKVAVSQALPDMAVRSHTSQLPTHTESTIETPAIKSANGAFDGKW